MKAKDLLLAINEHVNSNELSALAGSSAFLDVDVNDDTVKEVKTKLSSLLSIDAAKNNPDLSKHFKQALYPTIKGEILGNIDTDISQKTKTLFGDDAVKEFEGLEFTGDKINKVFELTKKAMAERSTDDKLKKTNDDLRKQLDELSNSFNSQLQEKEKILKQKEEDFKGKLINKEFTNLMSSYKLGEKYQDDFIKESLYSKMFGDIQKKAKLTFNDNGQLVAKHPENPELELFDGNKKIESIKQLLDPMMEPYITKQPAPGVRPNVYTPSTEKPERLSALAQSIMRKKAELKE